MPRPSKQLICRECHTITGHEKVAVSENLVTFKCCFCPNLTTIDVVKEHAKAERARRAKKKMLKTFPMQEER
jgi:hypothetical protein